MHCGWVEWVAWRVALAGVVVGAWLLAWGFQAPTLGAAPVSPGSNLPRFTIHTLGFDDPLHTLPGGYRDIDIGFGSDEGMSAGGIAGRAQRYTTSTAGYDGWLFTRHDQQVRQMGLLDPEYYVPPHSRHETRVRAINDAGQAVGYTNNDPSSSSGQDHGWYYDPATGTTTRIGYSTFPGVHPYTEDRPTYLLENGFVAGTSVLSTSSGRPRAWIYDPAVGVTQMVGLPESTDVGPNNEPLFQTLEAVTPNKLVVGTSGRNPGPSGPFHGTAVWVHRPGAAESERIGLYDESYTRKDLQKISYFDDVNDNGLVVGRSEFPIDVAPMSNTAAWIYDSATGQTKEIGLANPLDGKANRDMFTQLTASNHAVGTSWIGNSQLNWVYNHATGATTIVGLRDSRHTDSNGRTYSEINATTDSGFVMGVSRRAPNLDSTRNHSTWIYSPVTGEVTEAGLFAGRLRLVSDGFAINEAGQAIGTSQESLATDRKAWFYDPQTRQTIDLGNEIGLHIDIDHNHARLLNQRGQVAGIAETVDSDHVVWFYDHDTRDTWWSFDYRDAFTHERHSDHVRISLHTLTDSGLLLGSTERHQQNGADAGHTPWLHDSNTGETYGLVFSQSSRGQALTHIAYLSDDGVMLGEYDHFSPTDERTRRYFYWSIEHGFHDLETLIDGDLAALGWESLSALLDSGFPSESSEGVVRTGDLFAHDSTFLWGYGQRSGGYELPFALIQVTPVPEPGAWLLVLPGVAVWLARRGRQRN